MLLNKPSRTKETVQIFTGGSSHSGKVGAAAVITRAGKPNRTLHYHLEPEGEHTVHEAELTGIPLAIQLIKTEKLVTGYGFSAKWNGEIRSKCTRPGGPGSFQLRTQRPNAQHSKGDLRSGK